MKYWNPRRRLCLAPRSKSHSWDRAVYSTRDDRMRKCLRCGDYGYERCAGELSFTERCEYCVEANLRDQAWREHERVIDALRADEEALIAEIPIRVSRWQLREVGTPDFHRQQTIPWLIEKREKRARQWEQKQQLAKLQEGKQTLRQLRIHLRNPGQSQLLEYAQGKTSPT